MEQVGFDEHTLALLGLEDGAWGYIGLALLLAAAVLALWSTQVVHSRRRRALLLVLRIGALLALAALILQPAIRLRHVIRRRAHVVFMVDASRSMGIRDRADGPTRASAAAAFFRDNEEALQQLAGRFAVDVYAFGGKAAPASRAAASEGIPSDEPHTDLLTSLDQAVSDFDAEELAAVVLISDGRNQNASQTPPAPPEGVPVHALAPAEPDALVDLAVSGVSADDFAFVRTQARIRATITSVGLEARTVPVSLLRGGVPLVTREAALPAAGGAVSVDLPFTPERVGRLALAVEVPTLPGEGLHENNRLDFRLEVLRDRLRVLHVAGRPSWDVRFLRELLKRDPSIDLVSFFILRTPGDHAVGRNDELSLIRFPVTELFTEAIDTFDLIIFQNFTYRGYRMRPYLKLIRDYVVDKGGAFLMIGGDQSFADGGYSGTYIEDILPLRLGGSGAADEQGFKPRLTEIGQRHPVTALAPGKGPNRALWDRLPELPGCNLGLLPKPGAALLAVHPLAAAPDGTPAPLLAVGEAGSGRTMAVAWDGSWRWRFSPDADDASARAYRRFWRGALRWLSKDPEAASVRFVRGGGRVEAGLPVEVLLRAVSSDYGSAAGATVRLRIEPATGGAPLAEAEGRTDADGLVRLELGAPEAGSYQLVAEAFHQGALLGQAREVLVAGGADPELLDPRIDAEGLERLAEATDGSFRVLPADLADLEFEDPEPLRVAKLEDEPLWDRAWALALVALLLGGEWLARRRFGLF